MILDCRAYGGQLLLGAEIEVLLRALAQRQSEHRQRHQIHQQHQREHQGLNAILQAEACDAHGLRLTHSVRPGCA
jgi:hypothetical protein